MSAPVNPRQTTRGAWHDAARKLKADNPDMSDVEIGRRLGVTKSAVWKLFNNEKAREWCRRDNAKPDRHAAKVAWGRDHPETWRNTCPCGAQKMKRSAQCHECANAVAEVRRTLAEGMWAVGWSTSDLADVFGLVGSSRKTYFAARRDNGWDLPYRYKGTKRQRPKVTETSPFYERMAA